MCDRQKELIAEWVSKPGFKGKAYAKCIECIFDSNGGGGSWRQQVEACTSVNCPLYSVRPLSTANKEGDL